MLPFFSGVALLQPALLRRDQAATLLAVEAFEQPRIVVVELLVGAPEALVRADRLLDLARRSGAVDCPCGRGECHCDKDKTARFQD
jgi:hypothetical protein